MLRCDGHSATLCNSFKSYVPMSFIKFKFYFVTSIAYLFIYLFLIFRNFPDNQESHKISNEIGLCHFRVSCHEEGKRNPLRLTHWCGVMG